MDIGSGEFVCIAGASGSGKTTLLNILGGLDRPTAGVYRFDGQDVAELNDDGLARLRSEAFGFVFQSYNLLTFATAQENVEMPGAYLDLDRTQTRLRARGLLESVGMGTRLDHRPDELSGGEQQRVAIARALMNGARVILADEPTGALDSRHGGELLVLLEELAASGHTVIVASHDKAVAARADRRIEVRDGRIVSDTVDESPGQRRAASRTPPLPARNKRRMARIVSAVRHGCSGLRGSVFASALAALGVMVAVGSVITVLGLVEGTYQASLRILAEQGADRISVGSTHSGADVRSIDIDREEAEAIAAQVANVRATDIGVSGSMTVWGGGESALVQVFGETRLRPRAVENVEWPLARGSYLTRRDSEDRAQIALLGPTARDNLFGPDGDALGEQVQIGELPYFVKGVLADHPPIPGMAGRFADMRRENFGNRIYVPYETASELIFTSNQSAGASMIGRSIKVSVEDPNRIEETAADVRDLLLRRHGREGFGIHVPTVQARAFREARALRPVVVGTTATIALLAGGLGVMCALLVSVGQRRREIGVRIAVGARWRDILAQFLTEAVVVAFVGATCGGIVAFLAASAVSGVVNAPVAFAPWFVPAALGCGIACGLVFGLIPAWRAAKLDPAVVLAER